MAIWIPNKQGFSECPSRTSIWCRIEYDFRAIKPEYCVFVSEICQSHRWLQMRCMYVSKQQSCHGLAGRLALKAMPSLLQASKQQHPSRLAQNPLQFTLNSVHACCATDVAPTAVLDWRHPDTYKMHRLRLLKWHVRKQQVHVAAKCNHSLLVHCKTHNSELYLAVVFRG